MTDKHQRAIQIHVIVYTLCLFVALPRLYALGQNIFDINPKIASFEKSVSVSINPNEAVLVRIIPLSKKEQDDLLSILRTTVRTPLPIWQLVLLDHAHLHLLRNDIYAQHGYVFQSKDLVRYFSSQQWYVPVNNFTENLLSRDEANNVSLIKLIEDLKAKRKQLPSLKEYPFATLRIINDAVDVRTISKSEIRTELDHAGIISPTTFYVCSHDDDYLLLSKNEFPQVIKRASTFASTGNPRAVSSPKRNKEGELFITTDDFATDGYVLDVFSDGSTSYKARLGIRSGLYHPDALELDDKNNEIIVANTGSSTISVFGKKQSGDVTPLRSFTADKLDTVFTAAGLALDETNDNLYVANAVGNRVMVLNKATFQPARPQDSIDLGGMLPSGLALDKEHNELLVASNWTDNIKIFGRTADGSFSYLRQIVNEEYRGRPIGIAVDSAHNELFVPNCNSDVISVYRRMQDGAYLLVRKIRKTESTPLAVALNPEKDEIYVVSIGGRIAVYGRMDDGYATPRRTIVGPTTELKEPGDIAFDQQAREIFVSNRMGNSITVYAEDADGDVPPLRKIASSLQPGRPYPRAIVLNPDSGEVFIADSVANSVTVYQESASVVYAQVRKIEGPAAALASPTGIALDQASGLMYVSNVGKGYPYGAEGTITIYNMSDNGNVAPLKTLKDPSIRNPVGVAVDPRTHELFIADSYNSIVVFAPDATRNLSLARTIQGHLTGLDQPTSITIDAKYSEIIVTNAYNYADPDRHRTNSVTVYDTSMSGDVLPKRTLSGTATKIKQPVGLTIDHKHDRLYVVNRITKQKPVFKRSDGGKTSRVKSLNSAAEEAVDIVVFHRTDNGNSAPFRTISLEGQDSAHSIFILPDMGK